MTHLGDRVHRRCADVDGGSASATGGGGKARASDTEDLELHVKTVDGFRAGC
jgi:hypothetical protein